MLLSADANVPTAAAIDLRESIRRDGGTAATVAEMGEFGRGGVMRRGSFTLKCLMKHL